MQTGQISQIAAAAFSALGITDPLIETILLKDRNYVGRKFQAGGFTAVWLEEKNAVEIIDQEGRLVQTIGPSEGLKRAA
jgi:hypothetical protein